MAQVGSVNSDEDSFAKTKNALIRALVVRGIEGSEILEAWQKDFVSTLQSMEESSSSEENSFYKAFKRFIENRAKKTRLYWNTKWICASRKYVCDICKMHIFRGDFCLSKGESSYGGQRYCLICSLLLIRTRLQETESLMSSLQTIVDETDNEVST